MKLSDIAGQTELGWDATNVAGETKSGVVRDGNHLNL